MHSPEIVTAEVINGHLVKLTVSHHQSHRTDVAVSYAYVCYDNGEFHVINERHLQALKAAEVSAPSHTR